MRNALVDNFFIHFIDLGIHLVCEGISLRALASDTGSKKDEVRLGGYWFPRTSSLTINFAS